MAIKDADKLMYASEKEENFRWISRIVASQSTYAISDDDRASKDIEDELEQLGQYAEIASNNTVPISFILSNIDILTQHNFPLEGYHALRGGLLVSEFFGRVSDLHCYIAYRPSTKQLLVATSGTTSSAQAIQDLRFLFELHPSGHGKVHTGFWALYQGLKDMIMDGLAKGFAHHDVEELVLTGHSMGGAISYLLTMDILAGGTPVPKGTKLKVASFGSPRAGDQLLVKHWRQSVLDYRKTRGQDAFVELCIKGYNDGVHSLPPHFLGYRHFTERDCFYLVHGRLYRIPPHECEASLFKVPPSEDPIHPRGGHNYYNGHDMEKVLRRLKMVDVKIADWVDGYRLLLDQAVRQGDRSSRLWYRILAFMVAVAALFVIFI